MPAGSEFFACFNFSKYYTNFSALHLVLFFCILQDAFRQASVLFTLLPSLPLSEAVNFNIYDMIVSIYREIVKGIVPLTEKQKQAVVATSEDRKKYFILCFSVCKGSH